MGMRGVGTGHAQMLLSEGMYFYFKVILYVCTLHSNHFKPTTKHPIGNEMTFCSINYPPE